MNNKIYNNLILFGLLVDVSGIIIFVLTLTNGLGNYNQTYYYIISAALIIVGALIVSFSAIMTYAECMKNKKKSKKKK